MVGVGGALCGSSSPTPPAEAGSPTAGCTGPCPGRSWISPEKENPQPPWAACSSALWPSERRSSSSCSDGTSYASVCAHCPLSCRWAPLKRAWPHPPDTLSLAGIRGRRSSWASHPWDEGLGRSAELLPAGSREGGKADVLPAGPAVRHAALGSPASRFDTVRFGAVMAGCWMSGVDTRLGELKSDFRWVLQMFIWHDERLT